MDQVRVPDRVRVAPNRGKGKAAVLRHMNHSFVDDSGRLRAQGPGAALLDDDPASPGHAPRRATPPDGSGNLTKQQTMHTFFREMNSTQREVSLQTLHHSCRDRCAYKFDQGFQSPLGQGLGVTAVIAAFVAFGTLLISSALFAGDMSQIDPDLMDPDSNGTKPLVEAVVAEAAWLTWVFIADPGTHADVKGTNLRWIAAFVTISGIILSAMVIGLIVDGIKKKMDDLERGRGRVTEHDHILLLGWTEKTVQVINQLALMMESEEGGTILVVSEMTKKEAEAELRERCNLRGSKLVVRTGNMMAQSDLLKFSCHLARSIIVLAPDGAPDKADAQVLRTVLSMRGIELNYGLKGHIVAEMRDIDNTSLVDLVGAESVETIVSHDVVGRLMIQAARMRGLAQVYSSLLGFEDDEIYVKKWPEFTGETFEDVLGRFNNAVVIGISRENPVSGQPDIVDLNPPGTHVMRMNESLVVIAEDDDSYEPMDIDEFEQTKTEKPKSLPPWNEKAVTESILMTGWRRDIDDVIVLLDELVSPGSELHMISELTVEERISRLKDGGLNPAKDLHNLKLVHHVGNPAVRRQLKGLKNPTLSQFDSVLILADEALEADMMHSDSNCLAILLLVRDLQLKDDSFSTRMNARARRMSSIEVIDQLFAKKGPKLGMKIKSTKSKLGMKLLRAANSTQQLELQKKTQRGGESGGQRISDESGGAEAKSAVGDGEGPDIEDSLTLLRQKISRRASGRRPGAKGMASLLAGGGASAGFSMDQHPPTLTGDDEDEEEEEDGDDDEDEQQENGNEEKDQNDRSARDIESGEMTAPLNALDLHDKGSPPKSSVSLSALQTMNGSIMKYVGASKNTDEERGPSKMRKWATSEPEQEHFKLQKRCLVTVELLDPQTHMIIMDNKAISHMSDYVLSNDTVSKVLAMVAESREVKTVLKELLGSQGCDIMVYPPARFCDLQNTSRYSYWELFDRVRLRGEILLGWIHHEDGLHLNPKGGKRLEKLKWKRDDRLVILSQSRKGSSRTRSDTT